MKKEKYPNLCKAVQYRIEVHFEQPTHDRRYEILRDPLFIEGLLEHIIGTNEEGRPYLACADCWQRYHDLLASVREET